MYPKDTILYLHLEDSLNSSFLACSQLELPYMCPNKLHLMWHNTQKQRIKDLSTAINFFFQAPEMSVTPYFDHGKLRSIDCNYIQVTSWHENAFVPHNRTRTQLDNLIFNTPHSAMSCALNWHAPAQQIMKYPVKS